MGIAMELISQEPGCEHARNNSPSTNQQATSKQPAPPERIAVLQHFELFRPAAFSRGQINFAINDHDSGLAA
jgi:hypothetical protein